MIFIDYQNVHLIAHDKFNPPNTGRAATHVDPLKISELLISRRINPSSLVDVRVYRGRPNPEIQPVPASANDRQTQAWVASGVTVVRRQLRYPPDWPTRPAQEKGIDVALAVDFVRLALEQRYDVGVVFSSDTDLLPALETVAEFKLASIEVAAWSHSYRLRFAGTTRPWCHELDRSDYLAVLDPTDYRKPPPRSMLT
jgi:uncharacterized LabA/DUF88 family protein